MNEEKSNSGFPIMHLENPEVVKLRIAKEHMDMLFGLKKEQLHSVTSTLWHMMSSIEALEKKISTYSVYEATQEISVELDTAYRSLFTYATEFKIFDPELRLAYLEKRHNQDYVHSKEHQKNGNFMIFLGGRDVAFKYVAMQLQSERMELLALVRAKIDAWRKVQLCQLEAEIRGFLS